MVGHLGAVVTHIAAPFVPESGAYAHAHHDHDHDRNDVAGGLEHDDRLDG
jgi:hypothetical protein